MKQNMQENIDLFPCQILKVKARVWRLALLLWLPMLFFSSCKEKDVQEPYSGDFAFHTTVTLPGSNIETVTDYDGHVFLSETGLVMFHIQENQILEVLLSEDGVISNPQRGFTQDYWEGKFIGYDRLTLYISELDPSNGQLDQTTTIVGKRR